MAEVTPLTAEQATNAYQEWYGDNYIYYNALSRPHGNVMLLLEMAATAPIVTDQGKGLSYYVRKNNRSGAGYAINATGALSHLAAAPEAGSQIRVAFDEIYVRVAALGKEVRSALTQETSFVDFFKSINDDATRRYTEVRSVQILYEGSGRITTVKTGATITNGSSGDIVVNHVELLGEAIKYSVDIYAADNTTLLGNNFQINTVSGVYGEATVNVTNNSGGTVVIADGSNLYVQQSFGAAFLMGFKSCIDDGTEYPIFPRQVSGGSQVGLDRSTAEWSGLRSQVVRETGTGVTLSFAHLDALDTKMNTGASFPMMDENGRFIATTLSYLLRASHMRAIQASARSIGREFTLSQIGDKEDNGLRYNTYNDRALVQNPFCQPDQVMLVSWPDTACGWDRKLAPLSPGTMGPLIQTPDTDFWTAAWSERFQMITRGVRNCGRISGVIGLGDSA